MNRPSFLSAPSDELFFECRPKLLDSLGVPVYLHMHSSHAQRADLRILYPDHMGLPALSVHRIFRNLLAAQLDQIFAHEPKWDARRCKLKSRLICHRVSSTADRWEYINDVLHINLGLELIGQIGPVAPIDEHVHVPAQAAVWIK